MAVENNIPKEEFVKMVFSRMRLPKQSMELAEAIYRAPKISELSEEETKQFAIDIVEKTLIYFGHFDFEGKDKKIHQNLCTYFPKELKSEYKNLTIPELKIGINKAIRNHFGEYRDWSPSIKTFRDLITRYENSELRKQVCREYKHAQSTFAPTDFISEEQKEQMVIQGIIYEFNQYKQHGHKHHIGAVYYHAMTRYCAIPDYKSFIELAKQVVSKTDKRFNQYFRDNNTVTLSDTLNNIMTKSAELEAKKMAIKTLFNQLIQDGIEIESYMNIKPVVS